MCVCIYRGTITKGKDASVNAQVFSIPGRSSLPAANIVNSRAIRAEQLFTLRIRTVGPF